MYKILFFTILLLIPESVLAQVIGPVREGEERFVAYFDVPSVKRGTLTTSQDGRSIAWVERLEGKEFVVLDGVPQKRYDEILLVKGGLFFGSEGNRITFYGRQGREWFLILGNVEVKLFDVTPDTSNPGTSKDPLKEDKKFLDDTKTENSSSKEKGYLEMGSQVLSHDKKRMAFGVKTEGGWSMVVDGKEGRFYDRVGTPSFSPDGKRVAYIATLKGKQSVIVDGIEGDWYDAIYPRAWQEGTDGAGIGFLNSGTFYYFAVDGQRIFFITESIY
ncbi:MAG: hypothetical protein N2745_04755 [Syntrophorhabdaceae bacterium]|nr:hypothetical protein [Syntrophorhabdaceae bacterium]